MTGRGDLGGAAMMPAGAGWVICGWGPQGPSFWSDAEKAWVSRDRATLYPTRAQAEAASPGADLSLFVQMRTVLAADRAPK
jgi:hypothetical protein